MNCILCNSEETNIIESLRAQDLISLYKRAFGINVENILNCDLDYYCCKNCDLRFFALKDGKFPTGDDNFYNTLNKLEWYYMSEKNEYHYAKNFIDTSSKILEVGCGRAAFTSFIPNKENYTGLEFSSDAKTMAAKDNINIENISIEEFAKNNKGKFDIACSFQVLEHVANPHNFIKAQIECLTGGGVIDKPNSLKLLIIAVPSEDSFIKYATNGILNMPPHHISRYSDKTLENITKIFNLELVEIHHENIQKEHFDFYKATIWAQIFLKPRLIDESIYRKIINRFGIIGKKFIKVPPNAIGHTVSAVYRIKQAL